MKKDNNENKKPSFITKVSDTVFMRWIANVLGIGVWGWITIFGLAGVMLFLLTSNPYRIDKTDFKEYANTSMYLQTGVEYEDYVASEQYTALSSICDKFESAYPDKEVIIDLPNSRVYTSDKSNVTYYLTGIIHLIISTEPQWDIKMNDVQGKLPNLYMQAKEEGFNAIDITVSNPTLVDDPMSLKYVKGIKDYLGSAISFTEILTD